jgi:hypothetical protein
MNKDAKCQHGVSLMTGVLNFLIYQFGWFACVLGAAYHWPWFGTAVALSLICVHMMLTTDRPNQARLLFAALCVGFFVDTLLLILGVSHDSNSRGLLSCSRSVSLAHLGIAEILP